jgi:formamidopyrimidine-DNA glycosylase
MPELIDLEVMRENILRKVKGKKLKRIDIPVVKVLRNCSPLDVKDSLEGKALSDIKRTAKLLEFQFEGGSSLVMHLMLHGNMCWKSDKAKKQHIVCEMEYETGDEIWIKDWSAWLKLELSDPAKDMNSDMLSETYGPDPFSDAFNEAFLCDLLSKKGRSNVKSILMNQQAIAGVGNAYADEILFDAKIHPKSTGKGIVTSEKCPNLYKSVKKVLNDDLDIVRKLSGGESITEQPRDFMKVYRKNGQKCPTCGYMIAELKVNGRDTFVCEKCQEMLK